MVVSERMHIIVKWNWILRLKLRAQNQPYELINFHINHKLSYDELWLHYVVNSKHCCIDGVGCSYYFQQSGNGRWRMVFRIDILCLCNTVACSVTHVTIITIWLAFDSKFSMSKFYNFANFVFPRGKRPCWILPHDKIKSHWKNLCP